MATRDTLLLAGLFAACNPAGPPTPTESSAAPAASAAVTATPNPPAATATHDPPAASVAPPAPRAPEGDTPDTCMSAKLSQERAKPHRNADPPFSECAAGVFAHCGPNAAYCSRPLDAKATATQRKKTPGVCCYSASD